MRVRRSNFIAVIVPVSMLALWMLISQFTGVKRIVLPSPSSVATTFADLISSGSLWSDIALTLWRTGLGFLLGIAAGVLLGAAMGSWRYMHDLMILPVDALRSIPATTLFPIFMLCLGWGTKSLVALVAFPCCWLVTINTMYGVRNSSKVRREMATMFHLSGRQRFFHVTLPDAVPSIAASLRLSVAISLHMAIIGEMFMGTTNGLGYRIFDSHMLLRIPEVYALIIIVGTLGYLLNSSFVWLEKRMFFWGGTH